MDVDINISDIYSVKIKIENEFKTTTNYFGYLERPFHRLQSRYGIPAHAHQTRTNELV